MCKKVIILVLLIFTFSTTGCTKDNKRVITISVAASLNEPIKELVSQYNEKNDIVININTGGSGTLKKQITEGGDIDVFFSANEGYVDELIHEGLINEKDKKNPLTNTLVVVKNNSIDDRLIHFDEVKNGNRKFALGDFNTVPAGQYGKEALENMDVWNEIREQVILCKDVTATKAYVERGEVDYAIIYKSDSVNLKNSSVVYEIDHKYYSNIKYSMAPIKDTGNYDESKRFVDFLVSDSSLKVFEKYGFVIGE